MQYFTEFAHTLINHSQQKEESLGDQRRDFLTSVSTCVRGCAMNVFMRGYLCFACSGHKCSFSSSPLLSLSSTSLSFADILPAGRSQSQVPSQHTIIFSSAFLHFFSPENFFSPSFFTLFTVTLSLIFFLSFSLSFFLFFFSVSSSLSLGLILSLSLSLSPRYMPHIKPGGKEQLFNQNCHQVFCVFSSSSTAIHSYCITLTVSEREIVYMCVCQGGRKDKSLRRRMNALDRKQRPVLHVASVCDDHSARAAIVLRKYHTHIHLEWNKEEKKWQRRGCQLFFDA